WMVFAAAYAAAAAFAVHLAITGRGSVGSVVLVLSLGAQGNQHLADLTGHISWLVHTHRAVRRFLWLIDRAATAHGRLLPPTPAGVPERLREGIRLAGVSFVYPGTAAVVLRDVDLLLPAGSTVAMVGENGAGKTTLVKLLCRFYEPTTGSITVDGVDLREIP